MTGRARRGGGEGDQVPGAVVEGVHLAADVDPAGGVARGHADEGRGGVHVGVAAVVAAVASGAV